jgi:hypothetical protein
MRTRLDGLALVTLGGAALAACNLALGLGNYDVPGNAGGSHTGGSSTTKTTSATTSTGTNSGGGDGGLDGDSGGDAEAGAPSRAVWAIQFGPTEPGPGPTVNSMAVRPSDGHIFLTGATNGWVDFGCATDAGTDGSAAYLLELDKNGACVWVALFGSAGAQGTGVAVDPVTNNVVVAASFTGSCTVPGSNLLMASATDSFVAMYDPSHTTKWYHQIGDAVGKVLGNQVVTSVSASAHRVVIGGWYFGTLAVTDDATFTSISTASAGKDAFLYALTDLGMYAGDVQITGPMDQVANGVAINAAGRSTIGGTSAGATQFVKTSYTTSTTDDNAFLASYGEPGAHAALETVLGDSNPQEGQCVAFDASGNLLLGTTLQGTIPATQGDAGMVTWSSPGSQALLIASFLDQSAASAVQGIVFGSSTASDTASLAGIAVDGTGNVFVAGGFTGSGKFTGGTTVKSAGGLDVWVARLDPMLASAVWVENYGDNADQTVTALAVGPDNDVVIAGQFEGTVAFGAPTKPLHDPNATTSQLFVAKLKP